MDQKPLEVEVCITETVRATRQYKNLKGSDYWNSFYSIVKQEGAIELLTDAWNQALPPIQVTKETLIKALLGKLEHTEDQIIAHLEAPPLPVAWHLDYIARDYLSSKPKSQYQTLFFKTNSFRDYRATEIISKEDILCCPPFFEPVEADSSGRSTPSSVEAIRGIQDTYIYLAPTIKEILSMNNGVNEKLVRLFSWFEVDLKINVIGREKAPGGQECIRLTIERRAVKDCKKRDQKEFQEDEAEFNRAIIYGNSIRHKSWFFPGLKKKKAVLLSSPKVRKCIGEMSTAWHNKAIRKLLFLAPPGSGKEVLVELFKAARGIGRLYEDQGLKNTRTSIVSTELKNHAILGDELDKVRKLLNKDLFLKPKYRGGWQRPVLFIDEIHQARSKERAALLRILEEDKFRNFSGERFDLHELIWIFAASELREELLSQRKPPDFWTRMDQIIELEHPLALDPFDTPSGETREEVLIDYFWKFWRGTDVNRDEEIEAEKESPARTEILGCLLSDEAFKLAKKFAACVGAPLMDIFSIRYIRGMARRIKGQAVLLGLEMSPVQKEQFLTKAESKIVGWTIRAFQDMVKTKKLGVSPKAPTNPV